MPFPFYWSQGSRAAATALIKSAIPVMVLKHFYAESASQLNGVDQCNIGIAAHTMIDILVGISMPASSNPVVKEAVVVLVGVVGLFGYTQLFPQPALELTHTAGYSDYMREDVHIDPTYVTASQSELQYDQHYPVYVYAARAMKGLELEDAYFGHHLDSEVLPLLDTLHAPEQLVSIPINYP
jgi:hypothetical protein